MRSSETSLRPAARRHRTAARCSHNEIGARPRHRLARAREAFGHSRASDLEGRKFPLLWCYFERGDHLDVVRLLGERQDIATILGAEFDAD